MAKPLYLQAIHDAQTGVFVATPNNLRALRKYAANGSSNPARRTARTQIQRDLEWFGTREWPVDESYERDQINRIWGLCLLSDGRTFRNTSETRKLGARERYVIQHLSYFTFVGVHLTVDYRDAAVPGYERATDVYPVFRAYGGGAYMEFLFRPWQAHYLGENTGFYILGSGVCDETVTKN